MNQELMKHVERIVRPLRAGKVRKLAMRRELLAHLTAVFEEELATRGDEGAALEAARKRFGQVEHVRRELDRSLTWQDRAAYAAERVDRMNDWLGWRWSAPWWRFALGTAAGIAALHAAVGALLGLYLILAPANYIQSGDLPLGIRFLVFSMFGEFLFAVVVRAVFQLGFRSRGGWRWPAIVAILAGSCLITTGVGWLISWQLGDVAMANSRLPRMAVVSVLEIPLIVFLAILVMRYGEWREAPYREWSRLELGE